MFLFFTHFACPSLTFPQVRVSSSSPQTTLTFLRPGQGNKTQNNFIRKLKSMGQNYSDGKIPVVYRNEYNIKFFGLQKKHPFDSEKFGKVAKYLVDEGLVDSMNSYHKPDKVSDEALEEYHSKEYMDKLSTPEGLLSALEFNAISHVKNAMPEGIIRNVATFIMKQESVFMYALDSVVGNSLKYQVGGTILAGELAMEYGWAINIGGGMHHASANDGGGWCVYGDIQMSILNLRKKYNGKENKKKVEKAMIIDLDVHRGNGHAIDKGRGLYGDPKNIFIIDVFDKGNYPVQKAGKDQIDVSRGLSRVSTEEYLSTIYEVLIEGFEKFKPDVVFYNAGSDILASDPLGGFKVTPEGLIQRDKIVFEWCLTREIPIVMMTSGGYAKENAKVVGKSMKSVLEYIREFEEKKMKDAKSGNPQSKKNEEEPSPVEEEEDGEMIDLSPQKIIEEEKEEKKIENDEEKFDTELAVLASMGFSDTSRNINFLNQNNGDIERTIADLVS